MVGIHYPKLIYILANKRQVTYCMDPDIFSLFEANSKKEVEKICSKLTITSSDMLYLVRLSEAKIIEFPYLHASKLIEETPVNVHLTKKNLETLKDNGVGSLGWDAKKAVSKLYQAPLQTKRTMAHLFYRPDHRFWHLFYFDQKDTYRVRNHWDYGPHLHYVNWLWPNLNCQDVWKSYCANAKKGIGSAEHIRFKR